MSKSNKIKSFDPNGISQHDSLFGLPFSYEESETIVLPVPWEVTVSYSAGTAAAPEAIFEASKQVDLYDPILEKAWERGIYMGEVSRELGVPIVIGRSEEFREKAEAHISDLEEGKTDKNRLQKINAACAEMVAEVKSECGKILDENKRLILLGGDHSTPLGFLQALAERHENFGILQIDAHCDLRDAYEGFEFSHASIMWNALKISQIEKLVQIGIRDFSEGEMEFIVKNNQRVSTFFDRKVKAAQYRGLTWEKQCHAIVSELPQKVYLSFDIDGLDPKLCPNTGTPVAGGFETEEVLFLLEMLVRSGRQIIGMDLVEVAPSPSASSGQAQDEWDANVAARLLWRLANLMTVSQEK